jgi:hypothetical protein
MEHYEKLYIEESKNKKPIQCDDKTYSAKETAKRLIPDRELEYVAETGDKKPKRADYDNDKVYYLDLLEWQYDFSLWLCKRLEKAEKENKEKLIDTFYKMNMWVAKDSYFNERGRIVQIALHTINKYNDLLNQE